MGKKALAICTLKDEKSEGQQQVVCGARRKTEPHAWDPPPSEPQYVGLNKALRSPRLMLVKIGSPLSFLLAYVTRGGSSQPGKAEGNWVFPKG